MTPTNPQSICVIGDTHGHLQLALCMAARWQKCLSVEFEAVFLCGDVGTFTAEDQLDNATRRHSKSNACELEFLTQWSVDPHPAWLNRIFMPGSAGGLGLTYPVVMVHGNHEGFDHLQRVIAGMTIPSAAVPLALLPPWMRAGTFITCRAGGGVSRLLAVSLLPRTGLHRRGCRPEFAPGAPH